MWARRPERWAPVGRGKPRAPKGSCRLPAGVRCAVSRTRTLGCPQSPPATPRPRPLGPGARGSEPRGGEWKSSDPPGWGAPRPPAHSRGPAARSRPHGAEGCQPRLHRSPEGPLRAKPSRLSWPLQRDRAQHAGLPLRGLDAQKAVSSGGAGLGRCFPGAPRPGLRGAGAGSRLGSRLGRGSVHPLRRRQWAGPVPGPSVGGWWRVVLAGAGRSAPRRRFDPGWTPVCPVEGCEHVADVSPSICVKEATVGSSV